MNILVLNGSPRPKANTKAHIQAFVEGAEDMVVLASPIYYWGFTGQMMSVITRFYAPGKPAASKYAMFLSSGSPGVYDAPVSEYKSMLKYFGATNMGIITAYGSQNNSEEKLKEFRDFGFSL